MDRAVTFQETLRRLVIFDERFVEAGFGLVLAEASALDVKTTALVRVAGSVTLGTSESCLQWSVGRALAAGATEDEIVDVLLAIAPLTGLGRVVAAAPQVATALGYDIEAALEEWDDQ
jgi:alkylhydroperoxidase/carboxymuconolactone decarboxylase family protein YurZ